jgi:nucleoside-diphosphate-sugar epimerase
MKILLTGGNGFIGNYLKLNLKHEVVAPSSKELNLLDIEQVTEFLSLHKFDAVVHCAVTGRNRVYDNDGEIADKNLTMFFNLSLNRSQYTTLINFGSGAEFGLDHDVDSVNEELVLRSLPKESYGFSKSIITRSILETPNFYNLRIFACFDPSESSDRFFTKFKRTVEEGRTFDLIDRYIDFFSLEDTLTVVEAVLDGRVIDPDINLVYQNKLKASELLNKYCKIIEADAGLIRITGEGFKYTGDGSKLANYNLGLKGQDATLERYKD